MPVVDRHLSNRQRLRSATISYDLNLSDEYNEMYPLVRSTVSPIKIVAASAIVTGVGAASSDAEPSIGTLIGTTRDNDGIAAPVTLVTDSGTTGAVGNSADFTLLETDVAVGTTVFAHCPDTTGGGSVSVTLEYYYDDDTNV
jgi:hypothetical protein